MAISAEKQKFINEFVKSLSPDEAAVAAGFKSGDDAEELIGDQEIRDEIKRLLGDKLIFELSAIAFAEINDFVEIESGEVRLKDKLPEGMLAAVCGIENSAHGVKIKLNSKLRAIEMLGKILGVSQDDICDMNEIRDEVYGNEPE